MTAGTSARTRWPSLDGLRGIAAIVVVLFHAQFGFAVNGYVGVDVFFALSGFLITSILLSEIARRGTVRLRRFYLRRLLRLYPALVTTCLLVLAAGAVGGHLGEVGPGVGAALLYVANWWMYTGHTAPLLEHTWTLAIEEHFYFVWPLLLLALTSRRRWFRLLGAAAGVGLLIVIFTPWTEPIQHVRGTYLRGFPIVWGSLLAAVVRFWRGRWPTAAVGAVGTVATVGLIAVLLVPWVLPERWLTGPNSITGLLSMLVLAGVVTAPGNWGDRILSWPPLEWFGTRSYGLYLYHFPILQVARHQLDAGPDWARMVLAIVITLVVTWASFRWVEEPFLRLKDRIGAPRRVVTPTGRG